VFCDFKRIAITTPNSPVKKCSWSQRQLNQETAFESIIQGLIQDGFVIVDNFLPSEIWMKLGDRLEHKWRMGNFVEAGIGKGVNAARNEKIRGDHIHWLETKDNDPEETLFLDKISSLISYLNQTCFTGLKDFEFHYALYPHGTFYHRHLDQFKGDVARKYSVVNYLNDGWETEHGGQLVLYLEEGEKEILPIGGRLVCFESHRIEHEVKSATRPRKSITGWLRS
jgi:SM-20-related protein